MSTIRYATRIHDIRESPHLLLIHQWMRYGAGLAGGQFLRVSLERALDLKSSSPVDPIPGIRYHQFEKIKDLKRFSEEYLRAIDDFGRTLSSREIQEMVDEAKLAFQLNIDLMNDCAALAKL